MSPISSRLMTVRLRASPSNITIIQVYAPTSSYDDSEVDEFYRELQSLVNQTPKQGILVVQGDWNSKVVEDAQKDWGEVCGPSCNPETNDRGIKLLDFATYNNLVLANTLGNHKPSRRWIWHSPDGTHHPILREEMEAAVKALKMGKSAGVDNIPAEVVQAGGEAMIDILTAICNKIRKTGEWPTTWTQSLVITLPKKGNMQQNYRTISLISHPSKVMLKIIINRL